MAENNALYKIKKLQQRWISYQLLADFVLSASLAFVLTSIAKSALNWSVWVLPLFFAIIFGVLSAMHRPWRISLNAVCNFLDIAYPELEESSRLALKPENTLNVIERLQLNKVVYAIQNVPALPRQFTRRVKIAWVVFLATLLLCFGISRLHSDWPLVSGGLFGADNNADAPIEKILPQVASVNINIAPPGYTGKAAYQQDKFTINAEEGADVSWVIKTNIVVKSVSLLFNEKEKLQMKTADNDKTQWTVSKNITQPGFYQVSIDGKLSDLYQIQVIKDALPVIQIKTPKQYTHIDAGETPKVNLTVALNDDYGIADAQIFATVAKGSGESVRFKQYKMDFATSFAQHSRQYNVQKLLDLPALNMQPGDELYFYVQAQDNHRQTSRTDVYIVSIQDTAQLLSMDGILTGTSVKPEFFRSERQIIIDSQQLLKDKDSISVDVFNKRCNDLGLDQKLLRLRYGKFLGEEDESGREGNDDLAKVENFSNAQMFLDAFTDKHDVAEDATFLEPAVKEQLKATLSEMWKAELQLRLYKPNDALPFEYKALRLLKDLQQKSRAYVAKTAYNPPPLKIEKRLSGELDKIMQPVNTQQIKVVPDNFETLRKTASILDQLKYSSKVNTTDKITLEIAEQQLSVKASTEPGVYLPALSALQRILNANKVKSADIATVEKAIQKTLPQKNSIPSASQSGADMGLSQGYYKNLNHSNR